MSKPLHTMQASPVQYTLFTRVFGGVESPQLKAKLEKSYEGLRAPIEKMHLNDAIATAAMERANVPKEANLFITFSSDPAKMRRWELSADVKVIAPRKVEANLQNITRDFGACMAVPLLYGKDFLNRYSSLLEDFWKFDNDLFPMLMIGVPKWAPFKMIREGVAAQSRILHEIEGLYRRIDQYQKGEPVDFGADMSDISEAAMERNKVYQRDGWSFAERSAGDMTVFWGQNANTQPVLFWLLAYVYSTPGLLDRLREEIAPYVEMADKDSFEMVSMDIPGLSRNCQLLKACIFETYRLVNDPTSIRYVARPLTFEEDGLKHSLQAGTFISAPHAIINSDPSIFTAPEKFAPERFLEVDAESGRLVARYGRLKPWGVGSSMCKGRTFAEREIVSLSAAIMSLWNIEPASGKWELPATIPGTGVKKPLKDIRVVISPR